MSNRTSIFSFFFVLRLLTLNLLALSILTQYKIAKAETNTTGSNTTENFSTNSDVLIEISDTGLPNKNIETIIRQGMILFYNNTSESLLTLEIDFGSRALTCFSSVTPNLQFREQGRLTTTRPIAPGNFAATCFPVPGTYNYRIHGLASSLSGTITVSLE